MNDIAFQPASTSIRDRIRKAAPATMIGAVLMLYFGFIHMGRPSGDDLFHRAAQVLYCTLRFGGIAFAGISLLLYLAWPGATPRNTCEFAASPPLPPRSKFRRTESSPWRGGERVRTGA